jgi:hypothetical protein
MPGFVHAQVWRERRCGVPFLGDDVARDDDSVRCLDSALRHGNGCLADRNYMNALGIRKRFIFDEQATISPIERIPHCARRFDRLERRGE